MAFIDPFRKIQCPFCNKESYLSEYYVESGVNQGKDLYQPPQAGVGRFFSRFWNKPLDSYKGELASRKCSRCRKILPPNIERVDQNITIAVIGDTFSGKSHYIAALIDQLRRIQLPDRYFHVIAASQEIEERYLNEFYRPVFGYQRLLPATQTAIDIVNEPLIYEITLGETERRPRQLINLLIYDANGEELAQQRTLVRFRAHILNAKAIIFLADPWAMPEFVNGLTHHLRPDPANITGRMSSQVLAWVVQTFKATNSELAEESEFPLPVAIALSKADLIPYLAALGLEYGFLVDPINQRNPQTGDAEIIDQWVRKLLLQMQEDSLLGYARGFRAAKFFVISATGSSVDANGQFSSIRPYRCLDPLFWIFRELDILD